ncbi:MAG: hypothetical protein Tsb0034_09490 [Ekhidna sp.]
MSMTKGKHIVAYLVTAISVIVLIIYFLRVSSFKKQLDDIQRSMVELRNKAEVFDALARIDSLLLERNYDAAFRQYEELSSMDSCCDKIIALRKKAAKSLYNRLQNAQGEERIKHDTVKLIVRNPVNRSNYTDSLLFALKKADYQLQRLRSQLSDKSFGEYLTFQNKKGTTVHYVGQVKNGKANGRGVGLLSTGSRYEGMWKENQKHGEGSFYWPDGQYYVGSYVNDVREGTGSYFWPSGQKYVGEWSNDQRNGQGAFYNDDGELVAIGVWKEDKLVEDKSK